MSYQPNPIKKIFHNTRRFLAKTWLSHMSSVQIAITGSQGKTSTSYVINHMLKTLGPTICTDINLDTTYNVPITALKIGPKTHYALFELGVDHTGEMDSHLEIVHPKIAIITGISPVHTDKEHFGSLEALIKEKRKLIESLPENGYAILNGDDDNVRSMASYTKAKVLYYGIRENNDICASDIEVALTGLECNILQKQTNTKQQVFFDIKIPLIGKHHAYSLLAAYAVYTILGFSDFVKFRNIFFKIPSMKGRMNLEKGPMDTLVLNDSLRANPTSTKSGLETVSQLVHDGKKIAVLAEMGELQEPEKEHGEIGKIIATLSLNAVVLIGPLHKYTKESATKYGFDSNKLYWSENVIQASQILKNILKKNDLLYLKGSLLRHIERVPMILNGEKVGCSVIICPFYVHCSKCKYLRSGYVPKQ